MTFFSEIMNIRLEPSMKLLIDSYVAKYNYEFPDSSAFIRAAIARQVRHLKSKGMYVTEDLRGVKDE